MPPYFLNYLPDSSTAKQKALGFSGLHDVKVQTSQIVALQDRIGADLANLIDLGVDITRLDVAALAEAGQQLRRARAL